MVTVRQGLARRPPVHEAAILLSSYIHPLHKVHLSQPSAAGSSASLPWLTCKQQALHKCLPNRKIIKKGKEEKTSLCLKYLAKQKEEGLRWKTRNISRIISDSNLPFPLLSAA